jgi:hypothetical protein
MKALCSLNKATGFVTNGAMKCNHARAAHNAIDATGQGHSGNASRLLSRSLRPISGRLVLPCLIHAVAGRTSPAGERGSAAGSLLSSHYPAIPGPACCAGHHPSSPFALSGSSVGQRGILRSIHLLSCTCNTSYVRILVLFDIFLHPSRSPARQLLPLRHIQLTQPRLYMSRLLSFHCFLCDHRSCVQRELVGLVVAGRPATAACFIRFRFDRTRTYPSPSFYRHFQSLPREGTRCLSHTKSPTQQLIACKYPPHKLRILSSLLRILLWPCISSQFLVSYQDSAGVDH